jgi:hypothetical protein
MAMKIAFIEAGRHTKDRDETGYLYSIGGIVDRNGGSRRLAVCQGMDHGGV